jgi:hypothetical protein
MDGELAHGKTKELFTKKWQDFNSTIAGFLDYFNKNWVETKNGWYESFQIGVPVLEDELTNAPVPKNRKRSPAFATRSSKRLNKE